LGTDNGAQNARNVKYGLRWAAVSNTPIDQFKGYQGEGGLSAPAIVHLPGQTEQLPIFRHFTHVTDDTATFLELAGIEPPSTPAPALIDEVTGQDKNAGKVVYDGRYVYPVTGHSLLSAVRDETPARVHTEPFGGEAYGRAFLLSADGKWKIRWTEPPYGPVDGHWQLFYIENDRAETNDLSATYPDWVATLVGQWKDYLTSVGGVEPLRPRGYY
jgi:arylsulfatase